MYEHSMMAGRRNKYSPPEEERLLGDRVAQSSRSFRIKTSTPRRWTILVIAALISLLGGAVYSVIGYEEPMRAMASVVRDAPDQPEVISRSSTKVAYPPRACNSVGNGYQCFEDISHYWGQYSPYFSLADEGISSAVPSDCDVTFVQVLSRHGARFPTASKSAKYKALIQEIQANATSFKGKAAFLRSYNYTLGSDDLTAFGKLQMVNSGIKFYDRYAELARNNTPFVRSSGSSRVIESGQKFIAGFQKTKQHDKGASQAAAPKISVIISEDAGSNNTLNHNTCPQFEDSELGDDVADNYTSIFLPPIITRLESFLPGVSLSSDSALYLMDMCAFDTVSKSADGSTKSPFCAFFTDEEWTHYNYYYSLSKYYGYGAGNPLGPTQGVGFVNELIARLTRSPVHDHTTTNSTLDAPGAASFPLGKSIYADFTHDNGMIPIFFALGLYNDTAPLPRTHAESAAKADGFSAAWTVPFGARAYIEMMQCSSQGKGAQEPLVRVLVNDRVVPLHGCDVDELGRCRRDDFIKGLSFAKDGGNWGSCYA